MLYRGANILIMDEPTAVLAPQEIDELFETLRGMTADGASIVFISHKLDEVLTIADRVTVMRRGMVTAAGVAGRRQDQARPGPADGRPRGPRDRRQGGSRGRARRCCSSPTSAPSATAASTALDGVDLQRPLGRDRRPGRRGRQRPVRAGRGHHRPAGLHRQSITVNGEELANRPVSEAIDAGVAHVPEDRTGIGSAPNLSLTDNLIMKSYRNEPIGHGWTIDGERGPRTGAKGSRTPTRSQPPRSTPRLGCSRAATCSG